MKNKTLFFSHAILILNIEQLLYYASQVPVQETQETQVQSLGWEDPLKKDHREVGRSSGEGNGNPLRYFCLENPMDRGTWWATVRGVVRVGHD